MKKFIISSDALKKSLSKLSLAIDNSSSVPAMQNIYCKVNKTELEMIASNTEITISRKIAVESQESFELLMPFDYLNKLTGILKEQPIVIEHPSSRKARILCEDDFFEISLDKLEDYPKLPTVPKKNSIQLAEPFILLLHNAMMTCSADTSKSPLMKACLDIGEDETAIVSTDTNVIFSHKIGITSKIKEQLLFSHLMAKALKGMGDLDITWTDKQICFSSGPNTLWTTRWQDKYPDYKKVIPTYEANMDIERDQLIDALNKACLSSSDTKQTEILLTKEKGFIYFEYDDVDYGRKGHIKKPATYSGNVESVSINASKMLLLMDQVNVEKVRLHIHGKEKAILISSEEDKEWLAMISPLKINN